MATSTRGVKRKRGGSQPASTPSPCLSNLLHIQSAPAGVDVQSQRQLLVGDVGRSVNEVPTQFFTQGLLPPVSTHRIREIIAALKASGDIKDGKTEGKLRWAHFSKEPCQYKSHEDSVFRKVEQIVEAIACASGVPENQRMLKFVCRPTKAPKSTTRDNPSKPDSYGILTTAPAGDREWLDIAVPGEFKKDDTEADRTDNRQKVLWSMYHIMREDPTRRFVFGFTIENTNMRYWFVSRSEMFVSYKFSFIESCQRVILFFHYLLTATKAQLGWDETIRRVSPRGVSDNIVYDIEVGDKTYRTKRLISNVGAEAPRGRGTRVWEAVELDENGEETGDPVAIKDNWMDADRETEGELQKAIFSSATPEQREILERYFMGIVTESHVFIDGRPDHTHVVMRRNKRVAETRCLPVTSDRVIKKAKNALPVKGAFVLPQTQVEEGVTYSAKIHHRVVLKEVGQSLFEVESLSQVFSGLADALEGLRVLHKLGWVHRDISPGNILLVNGRGVITDLEYAKHVYDKKTHGVRTGTPFFMAIEIECGCYKFALEPSDDSSDDDDDDDTGPERDRRREQVDAVNAYLQAKTSGAPALEPGVLPGAIAIAKKPIAIPQAAPRVELRHNALHDIESVLWVGMWMTLCSKLRRPDTDDGLWDAYISAQSKAACDIFCNSGKRTDLLIGLSQEFTAKLASLHPRVADVGQKLNLFRSALVQRYRKVEKKVKDIGLNPAKKLHEPLIDIMAEISLLLIEKGDLFVDVGVSSEQVLAVKDIVNVSLDTFENVLTDREDLNPDIADHGAAEQPEDTEASGLGTKRRKMDDEETHPRTFDGGVKRPRTCED